MKTRYGLFGVACVSLTALGALAMPASAQGQDAQLPGNDPASGSEASNKPINLDLENADLYSALKLLFVQIKGNYILDPSLRQLSVTAKLTNIPFRSALDLLLKSVNSQVPLTYKVEGGVYSIIEKKIENGDTTGVEPTPDEPKSNLLKYRKFFGSTGEIHYNSFYIASLLKAQIIPSIVGQQQQGGGLGGTGGGGGFGGGGFGGGLGGGGGGFGGGGLGGGGGFGGSGGGGFGGSGGGGFGGGISGGLGGGGGGGRGF